MRILVGALVCLCAVGAARGDLEPRHVVDTKATAAQLSASRAASDAAQALSQGEFKSAITLADKALASNNNDYFAHYVRAESLSRLGRVDDAALAEYQFAERVVPANERWGHAIVLWGRANAFHQLGRCDEAKSAFNDYIAFVKSDDAEGAALAQSRIDGCRRPWVAPSGTPPATPAPAPAKTP
jgi:tetratricopeptide (TPR) repeat protein